MHAKMVSSALGVVQGSANFSRGGLYRNIEADDDLRYDSDAAAVVDAAGERAAFAEAILIASTDYNAEALAVLQAPLRTVSPEKAVSRCVAEQKGFRLWRADLLDGLDLAGVRRPFPYQADLVYEAAGTVYESGIAFVCAPAGSGKTAVGKYLAYELALTFKRVVPGGICGRMEREGAMVITPPRIAKRWGQHSAMYKVVSYTRLNMPRNHQALRRASVHIVDESHRVAPGLTEVSQRAEAMEDAPPAWTVFLSATQLGNHDVDSLTHFQEKRASLFMPGCHVAQMQELFDGSGRLTIRQSKTDQEGEGAVMFLGKPVPSSAWSNAEPLCRKRSSRAGGRRRA